jgi:hypothetical protein
MIKISYSASLLAILTFTGLKLQAQTDETAVKQVINNLFTGMKQSDTAMIRAAFSGAPILQTIARTREGQTLVRTEPIDSFLVSISRPHTETYDERISFGTIQIDGDLAMVWTPYKFYLGEKFSHCGVNSFQLVRLNNQWKIQYLIDTRRRQGCE